MHSRLIIVSVDYDLMAYMTYIALSAKNIQCQKAGYDQKIFAEIASQNKRV